MNNPQVRCTAGGLACTAVHAAAGAGALQPPPGCPPAPMLAPPCACACVCTGSADQRQGLLRRLRPERGWRHQARRQLQCDPVLGPPRRVGGAALGQRAEPRWGRKRGAAAGRRSPEGGQGARMRAAAAAAAPARGDSLPPHPRRLHARECDGGGRQDVPVPPYLSHVPGLPGALRCAPLAIQRLLSSQLPLADGMLRVSCHSSNATAATGAAQPHQLRRLLLLPCRRCASRATT